MTVNNPSEQFNVVGKRLNKIDGMSLVTGQPVFAEDIELRGLLYAKILPSPHAHAVLTYKDVPRIAHTTAGQGYPEPSPYDTFILDKKVRFVGDRVAAVAAESEEIALEALKLIKVEYEVLPAVLDPKKARSPDAPVLHDPAECSMPIPVFYDPAHNHVSHSEFQHGDVEKGFASSDAVVEVTTYAHYAQHCPIEPHICITYYDTAGRLVIRTSTQVPWHVRRIVSQALGIPIKNIRVIKPRIGGGFGTKQEVLLEQLCAALTVATRRPVKLALTRAEEFLSRTRHPQWVTVKIGAKADGTIEATSMKVLSNTGAYGSHGLTVLTNCGSKVLPLYRANHVKFEGDTVYSNLPVAGAYRGYGATQASFAMEVAMDMLARKLGIDSLELRKKNHIRAGESSPVFKALGEGKEGVEQIITSCGLGECIEKGAAAIGWGQKKAPAPPKYYGKGVACLMQGSSIPQIDMGAATMKMNDDGTFILTVGATDLGTGSDTVLGQIAAETLKVPLSDIVVFSSDTDFTPFDVGAYASSTTYLSGEAVRKAANSVLKQIMEVASEILGLPAAELEAKDREVFSRSDSNRRVSYKEIALHSLYMHNQHQIIATESHITQKSPPPFAAHFAEVEVDVETGVVKVLRYVAAVDCGTAINPTLAEGQTEGAVANGISYALTEEFIFDERGRMLNTSFNHYKIFSSVDMPEIITILVPTYEETGPYGAKSVSEISINGALPAISNAIYDAVGIRLTEGPFTPEKVLKALKEKNTVG
ncbi:MAG: molybdopterin cofactor-binding domain-containing protein [Thermoplasmata archaeon]